MLLIDTDVIIDFLRGNKKASDYLEKISETLLLSTVTTAELFAGIKGKNEHMVLTRFLKIFQTISVDARIAEMGGNIKREYGKSHGTGLADALLAATAISHDATLITLNKKHFPMVNHVIVPYKK